MPRTIHVTRTYSVHIEDDTLSDKQAIEIAKEECVDHFDSSAVVFERWTEPKPPKPRRGIGSY